MYRQLTHASVLGAALVGQVLESYRGVGRPKQKEQQAPGSKAPANTCRSDSAFAWAPRPHIICILRLRSFFFLPPQQQGPQSRCKALKQKGARASNKNLPITRRLRGPKEKQRVDQNRLDEQI